MGEYIRKTINGERIREHQIVTKLQMEIYKFLFPNIKWVTHHIDEDKSNNEITNLKIVSRRKHGKIHSSGKNNPMYGKHHNKNTKNKISIIHKNKVISIKQRITVSNKLNGNTWHRFRGACFAEKRVNPWTKTWRSSIKYNGTTTNLGYFNDPLSCQIVYDFVFNEIYGGG